MSRSQPLQRLLITSLALVYIAIGVVQYRQYRDLTEMMQRGDISALWTFAQLNIEYERLDHALNGYLLQDRATPYAQLRLRARQCPGPGDAGRAAGLAQAQRRGAGSPRRCAHGRTGHRQHHLASWPT